MTDTDGAAVLELQGEHAAQPMAGDVDLFTGEMFTLATGRAPVTGGGEQLGMF